MGAFESWVAAQGAAASPSPASVPVAPGVASNSAPLGAPGSVQGDPFDSWLAQQGGPASAPANSTSTRAPTPSATATSPGALAALGAGLGHGFGSVVLGAQQLLGHGAQDVGLQSVGNWLVNDAASGLRNIDAQYAPYAQAHPLIGGAGNVGGQIVATAPAMMLGPEYAGLSLPGKIGLGAIQGAAASSALPVSPESQSFWGDKALQIGSGTLLGAAFPAAAAGVRAVGSNLAGVLGPVVNPGGYVGRGLAATLPAQDAADVASNIRRAPTFVPGSMPTTAQVGAHPVLVQTEKAANNIPEFKTAFVQRAVDNNQARWNALNGVGRTPDAMQAAVEARTAATQPLYDEAANQTANVGRGFLKLAQRPAMQQAMQQADQLARNRGERLVWPQQGGDPAISGRALDYTKQALGDMIGNAKASGNKALAGGMSDALDQLNAWTQRYIPAQRDAAQAWARTSIPISTMEVGQQIANTLGTRPMNAGGIPEIQLAPYRTAFTQAMKGSRFGIDPTALATLQGIGQDLQRASVSNAVRSPGSDTAYNLAANGWLARNLYGKNFGGATGFGKAVGALGAAATGHPMLGLGILGGGNQLGRIVGGRLNARLVDLLMHPNGLLPYLDARAGAGVPASPSLLTAISGLLRQSPRAAVAPAASGLLAAAGGAQ